MSKENKSKRPFKRYDVGAGPVIPFKRYDVGGGSGIQEEITSEPLPQPFVGGGNIQRPHTRDDVLGTNRPDPTKPYFRDADQGGTWVDPLAPHTDFSHDIPQTVNPLNRPKPPTHGG